MKIFLDFDGLLVDNSLRLYTLYSDLLREFGWQPLPRDSYWALKRERISEKDILQKSGLEDSGLIELYSRKRFELIESMRYLQLNSIVDGCFDFLDFLKRQGEMILITTRRNRGNLLAEVERKNLAPYFSRVLCAYDAVMPPAEVKVKMIKDEGLMQGLTGVIIGDTEAEIICGQKTGLFTVAVTSGIRSREYLTVLNPDMIFDNVRQIAESWDSILEGVTAA